MRLRVLLPAETLVGEAVTKVVAEAVDGSFCLLPRHVDFVSVLVPGLLSYVARDGQEAFLGVDGGILVKRGQEVLVATGDAVRGPDLGVLRERIAGEFGAADERERRAQTAVARLEAGLVRRFLELGSRGA